MVSRSLFFRVWQCVLTRCFVQLTFYLHTIFTYRPSVFVSSLGLSEDPIIFFLSWFICYRASSSLALLTHLIIQTLPHSYPSTMLIVKHSLHVANTYSTVLSASLGILYPFYETPLHHVIRNRIVISKLCRVEKIRTG